MTDTSELTDEQRAALEEAKKALALLATVTVARHIAIAVAAKSVRTLLRRLGHDVSYRHVYQGLYAVYLALGAVKPVTLKGTKQSPLVIHNVQNDAKSDEITAMIRKLNNLKGQN